MSTKAGSCLCGAITFEVTQLEPKMAHCHCTMCRKFHGAAFATYGEAKADNFFWKTGQELLKEYRADNGTTRRFCSQCGSSLTFASDRFPENLVEFSLACLDDDIQQKPDAHIFTRYKANWFEITDELPQFAEGRK